MAENSDKDRTQSFVALSSGQTVSHYRIIDKIGAGGMGEVYLAEDTDLRRRVALKFMPSHLVSSSDMRNRFIREARAAATLNHPNIVTVHEVGQFGDRPFIVMEHVPGPSLREVIKDGNLSSDEAIELIIQICQGLHAAHEAGVVHRDVKPGNVVIDDQGRARILDFGLAQVRGDEKLTETGTTLGTVGYMSPEQITGKKVDHRSDLFSVGVLLYELLAGRRPFDEDNDVATIKAITDLSPEPLARFKSDVPDQLQQIVAKALTKDPELRYQHADGLMTDLKRLQLHSSEQSRATSGRTSRYRKVVWSGILLTVAVMAVLVLRPWTFDISPRQDAVAADKALAILNFENLQDSTDEQRVGQILQDLVITDLSDLTSVRVISRQRLSDIRRQLGHDTRGTIDLTSGSEVARNAGASMMLAGNIMQLGDQWIMTCQFINVKSGLVLKSHRIDGSDLYTMVDDLASRVRSDLTSQVIARDVVDLEVREKTTTSMEAYRHYLAGLDALDESLFAKAITHFDSAIVIDSTFVKAHYKRGEARGWQTDLVGQGLTDDLKSLLTRDFYISELDRSQLTGLIAIMEHRFSDAVSIYTDLTERYPDEKEVWNGLGEAYYHESQLALNVNRALKAFEKAIELDMTFVIAYRHAFHHYLEKENHTKVKEYADRLIKLRPENSMGYRFLTAAYVAAKDSSGFEMAFEQALRHHKNREELRALHTELARAYNWVDDFAHAEEHARIAFSNDPDTTNIEVVALLASTLYYQDQLKEAKHLYEIGLRMQPTSPWCLGGLANVALAQEEYQKSADYRGRLVDMVPQDPYEHAKLYEALFHLGRNERADSVLETGIRSVPSNIGQVELLIRVGRLHENNRQPEKAEAIFERALEVDTSTENVTVLYRLLILANQRGDSEATARYAQMIISINPGHTTAVRLGAKALVELGEVDEAVRICRDYIKKWPEHSMASIYLVRTLVAGERFAEVDGVVESAIAGDTATKVEAGYCWEAAVAYWQVDSIAKGREYANRGLQVDPEHKGLLRDYGRHLTVHSEDDSAKTVYEKLLTVDPKNLAGHLRMGVLYLRQGMLDDAQKWFEKSWDLDTSNATTMRNFAYLRCIQGRWEEALNWVRKAQERQSSFFNENLIAWVQANGKFDLEEGIEQGLKALERFHVYKRFIKQFPRVPVPQHSLGLCYLKTAQYEKAVEFLEQAAQIRPDNESIQQNLDSAKRLLET